MFQSSNHLSFSTRTNVSIYGSACQKSHFLFYKRGCCWLCRSVCEWAVKGKFHYWLLHCYKLKDGSTLLTNIAILRLRGHCAQSVLRCRDPGCHFTPASPRLLSLSPSVRLGLNQENLLHIFQYTRGFYRIELQRKERIEKRSLPCFFILFLLTLLRGGQFVAGGHQLLWWRY